MFSRTSVPCIPDWQSELKLTWAASESFSAQKQKPLMVSHCESQIWIGQAELLSAFQVL